jgi:hypothetical protein
MTDLEQPLLEILIATYNRPNRAINAVESCLKLEDDRILVSCSSNGREEKLLYLENFHPRLSFSYFETNQGPNKNWGKLLRESRAKFSLLLSDEDTIDDDLLLELLNWLEINNDISVANVGVLNADKSVYYEPNRFFEKLDFNKTRILFSEQTGYMSGYIFNNLNLKRIDLDFYIKESPGNVYGHINLAHKLLEYGNHGLFSRFVVLKGIDDKLGGHAYEHVKGKKLDNLSKLNPEVYGSYARAFQFYYMQSVIRKSFPKVSNWKLLLYDIDLLIGFYQATKNGNDNCGQNVDIFSEVKRAKLNSGITGVFSGTFTSYIFLYLFKFNIGFFINAFRILLSKYRMFLIKFVYL